MDLKRLPYLPIQYFYFQFSKAEKTIFWIALILILTSATFLGLAHTQPTFWSLESYQLQSSVVDEAHIDTLEANYRTYDIDFPVYWQKITHAAGPLLPKSFPLYLFWALQVLGWVLVLTAITQISSRWVYLFYLLFALFVHFSGVHKLWYAEADITARLIEFGIILSFLIPAYLFQSQLLTWSLLARLAVVLGIAMIWFGIPMATGSKVDSYIYLLDSYFYLVFLFVPYLIFVGKDLLNLLILVGNNRQKIEDRWPFWAIVSAVALFMMIQFLWINEFLDLNLFGINIQLGVRPTHLLILVGIFTIFTSQNLYNQVRAIFDKQFSFTILIAAWSILSLSFIAVNMSSGDLLFVYTIDRMICIFFFSVSLFYTFFTFFNHAPLLRKKVNMYYLLTRAREFNFYVVWLLALGTIVMLEGREKWKSFTLISHSYSLQIGDESWFKGNLERADKAYELASKTAISSVKGHYNRAVINGLKGGSPVISVDYYQKSVKVFDFPFGWTSASQLLTEMGLKDSSINVLRRGVQRMPENALLSNNLGVEFLNDQQPDSAILYFKQGLLANVNDAISYSNLALLYHLYQQENEAATFFKSSVDAKPKFPGVWTNYLIWNLLKGEKNLDPSPYQNHMGRDLWIRYHHLLSHDISEEDTLGLQMLRQVANQASVPEAILLDGWRDLQLDSMELGASRLTYLGNSQLAYNSDALYLLGLKYVEMDLPSMAKYYFDKMAELDPKGKYYSALMNLDRGFLEAANFELIEARGMEESLFEACSRELAILLKAYGQDLYAQTEWDLSTLTTHERIRTGIYADSLGQFAFALENFRQAIEFDSSALAPYLEMGKIYNKYKDSLAITNLRLVAFENSAPEIKREMARAFLIKGQIKKAESFMDLDSDLAQDKLIKGEWLLAKKDTQAAKDIWLEVLEAAPKNRKIVSKLANIYLDLEAMDAGYALMETALANNNQNPRFWYWHALFSQGLGNQDEALESARIALSLMPDSPLKQKVQQEFPVSAARR
ncbi:MAG: hypothetical protein AAFY71_08240 [Bacteroidota bacterium]